MPNNALVCAKRQQQQANKDKGKDKEGGEKASKNCVIS
jgi:hypothetical protein